MSTSIQIGKEAGKDVSNKDTKTLRITGVGDQDSGQDRWFSKPDPTGRLCTLSGLNLTQNWVWYQQFLESGSQQITKAINWKLK